MPDANYVQSSFLGGEWSQYAQGRFDKRDYSSAMNVCLNSFPLEEGACTRRSGERFLATTRSGNPGRLIAFDFEAAAPYDMEFTDGHMRFFGGRLNGPVQLITTNDDAVVTNISADKPAIVTTAANTWATNDQVIFNFANAPVSFASAFRNRVFSITVIDTTQFTITDAVTGGEIDGTAIWDGGPGVGVSVSRIADIVSPYVSGQWANTRSIQSDLGAILLNPSYSPRVLAETPPSVSQFATFNLSTAVFLDGPYLDPVALTGTVGSVGPTVNFSIPSSALFAFAATDIGRSIRLFSQPLAYNPATAYTAGAQVTFNDAYYVALDSSTGAQPDVSVNDWGVSTAVAAWTWGTITGFADAQHVTVTLQGGDLLTTNPILTWQVGVFSNTTGWPTCGTYHEGRLWLSGAVPNRVDSSKSNDTLNFAPTAPDGTVSDDNGISYIFNASTQNPIYWMQPNAQGIVCGTQGGEWLVQASALNDPLTPTSIQAHPVTFYGCANIEPRSTGLTLVFVQRWMRKLFEYFPDVFSGRYMAPNLSVNAAHITHDGIAELAFQKERTPIIWSRTATGLLAGCTYKRDSLMSSQGPEFVGWHRHQFGSGRTVESICVGPAQFSNLDGLAMVTNDPSNVRHVSVLTDIFDENDLLTSAWMLDDAIVPAGASVDFAAQTITFTGLWHLNGKTATVFAGGLDGGDALVANGQMTVPLFDGLENLFSLNALETASGQPSSNAPGHIGLTTPMEVIAPTGAIIERLMIPAVVGCTYMSQGQCLRQVAPQSAGAANGPALGKTQRAHQFVALIANAITGTVKFGTSFDHLRTASFKTKGQKAIPANVLYSGVHQGTIDDEYGFDSMICWQIDRPLPLTVAAFGGFLNTQDR